MLPLMKFRILFPTVCRYVSASVRRWLAERAPWPALQRVRNMVDTMDKMSHDIYDAETAALRAGEEAVVQQIGEGKDILSKLRESRAGARRSGILMLAVSQSRPTWLLPKRTSFPTISSSRKSRESRLPSCSAPHILR